MRLRTPFWSPDAPAPGAGSGTPGGGDADGEDGWEVESASVAFTPPPDDTTQAGAAEPVAGMQESHEESGSAPVTTDDGDEAHASAAEAGAEAPAEAVRTGAERPASRRPGKKPSDRVAELKKDIDRLTHTKHATSREIQDAEVRRTALLSEIADLEKRKVGAGEVAVAPAPADAEPLAPKYRDFATDEEYEAAQAKWRTDHSAWTERRLAARVEDLRKEVTAGVDTRLSTAEQQATLQAARQTMATTLEKVAGRTADWDARREAIKEIASTWYDPSTHPNPTPFLSDLSQSLLMEGREEGGDLLVWLGDDLARAQRVADLLPTRPLRDALVSAPSVLPLLEYFATDEGTTYFETLKQMHPVRMNQALGALYARLQPAPRGSGATAHPITQARPSARPQVGEPGARADARPSGAASGKPTDRFEDWMAAEDARELAERKQRVGLPA